MLHVFQRTPLSLGWVQWIVFILLVMVAPFDIWEVILSFGKYRSGSYRLHCVGAAMMTCCMAGVFANQLIFQTRAGGPLLYLALIGAVIWVATYRAK